MNLMGFRCFYLIAQNGQTIAQSGIAIRATLVYEIIELVPLAGNNEAAVL